MTKRKAKPRYTPTLLPETQDLIRQGAFLRNKTHMEYVHHVVAADVKRLKAKRV